MSTNESNNGGVYDNNNIENGNENDETAIIYKIKDDEQNQENNMNNINNNDNDQDNESEYEEEEEDPMQMIEEMGRHKKMQRIQKVLLEQLERNNSSISQELLEKEELLRRVKIKREEIGVSLYGFQQQLAQLQVGLDTIHTKYNELHENRIQTDEKLDTIKDNYKNNKRETNELMQKLINNQKELDALNITIRQVETYNEEMKKEIKMNRRAAHKNEENVTNLEKEKKKQDLYIDQLNQEIKQLKETITLHTFQLKNQINETKIVSDTLNEASKEMETISFEKKQLIQQWKSSVIHMQQRDQALQATQNAISKLKEEEISLASEVNGYKLSIIKAQSINETLTGTIERIEAEIKFTEENMNNIIKTHDNLNDRYTMLQKSMSLTDSQTNSILLQIKNIDNEINDVQQNLDNIRKERHFIENQINEQKNEQTTANKAANNLFKEVTKCQYIIQEKEILIGSMKNELARIQVDILNIQFHNTQLQETHDKLIKELKEKDTMVEKKELEIRQRNDEIEKKMLRVDRLNKKYEQITSKMEDVNTGPLEATIINLKRETTLKKKENEEKQREWLQIQTILVHSTTESESINEKNQELKSKANILEQKKIRLLNNVTTMENEIKGMKSNVTNMHTDITRLNELISQKSKKQTDISSENYGLEIDFQRELKELEANSIKTEEEINNIKRAKQQLIDEMIEIERQIMLWEKKIQLEKETQLALDPNIGQAEAQSMEKEIHRMKLRLETLLREQEKMINEMERAIHKRDSIALRGKGKKEGDMTQATLIKKISTLENDIRSAKKNKIKYDTAIKEKLIQVEDVNYELDSLIKTQEMKEIESKNLQSNINNYLYEKQRYIEMSNRIQRTIKRFEDLKNNKGSINDIKSMDENKIQQDFMKTSKNLDIVRNIIKNIQKDNGHLVDVLSRVLLLTEN